MTSSTWKSTATKEDYATRTFGRCERGFLWFNKSLEYNATFLTCIFGRPVVKPVLATLFSKENMNGARVRVCVCGGMLSDTVHKAPGPACLSMSRGCRLSQLRPWQQLVPAQSRCANTTVIANFRQNPLWFLTPHAKTICWWRNRLIHYVRSRSTFGPAVMWMPGKGLEMYFCTSKCLQYPRSLYVPA